MYGILHSLLQTLSFPKQLPGLCRQSSHSVPTPLLWAKPSQGQGSCSVLLSQWCLISLTFCYGMTKKSRTEKKAPNTTLPNSSNVMDPYLSILGVWGVEYHTAGNVWEKREKTSCICLFQKQTLNKISVVREISNTHSKSQCLKHSCHAWGM